MQWLQISLTNFDEILQKKLIIIRPQKVFLTENDF